MNTCKGQITIIKGPEPNIDYKLVVDPTLIRRKTNGSFSKSSVTCTVYKQTNGGTDTLCDSTSVCLTYTVEDKEYYFWGDGDDNSVSVEMKDYFYSGTVTIKLYDHPTPNNVNSTEPVSKSHGITHEYCKRFETISFIQDGKEDANFEVWVGEEGLNDPNNIDKPWDDDDSNHIDDYFVAPDGRYWVFDGTLWNPVTDTVLENILSRTDNNSKKYIINAGFENKYFEQYGGYNIGDIMITKAPFDYLNDGEPFDCGDIYQIVTKTGDFAESPGEDWGYVYGIVIYNDDLYVSVYNKLDSNGNPIGNIKPRYVCVHEDLDNTFSIITEDLYNKFIHSEQIMYLCTENMGDSFSYEDWSDSLRLKERLHDAGIDISKNAIDVTADKIYLNNQAGDRVALLCTTSGDQLYINTNLLKIDGNVIFENGNKNLSDYILNTQINGNQIITGSITSNKVSSDVITSESISSGSLTIAGNIKANSLTFTNTLGVGVVTFQINENHIISSTDNEDDIFMVFYNNEGIPSKYIKLNTIEHKEDYDVTIEQHMIIDGSSNFVLSNATKYIFIRKNGLLYYNDGRQLYDGYIVEEAGTRNNFNVVEYDTSGNGNNWFARGTLRCYKVKRIINGDDSDDVYYFYAINIPNCSNCILKIESYDYERNIRIKGDTITAESYKINANEKTLATINTSWYGHRTFIRLDEVLNNRTMSVERTPISVKNDYIIN